MAGSAKRKPDALEERIAIAVFSRDDAASLPETVQFFAAIRQARLSQAIKKAPSGGEGCYCSCYTAFGCSGCFRKCRCDSGEGRRCSASSTELHGSRPAVRGGLRALDSAAIAAILKQQKALNGLVAGPHAGGPGPRFLPRFAPVRNGLLNAVVCYCGCANKLLLSTLYDSMPVPKLFEEVMLEGEMICFTRQPYG